MLVFRALMIVALLVCLSPLFAMAVADAIAHFYGCKLDLVSAEPCMAGDQDIAKDLRTLAFMGYFLMATFPIALGVSAFWLFVEIIVWTRRRRARTPG